uniref:Uncharacterized protein n=1 Tax=Timema poppense TaxID=170557 RepID=A0A7R9D3R0_TIMPO|nr:unnamed protein product [Timema poppensis]
MDARQRESQWDRVPATRVVAGGRIESRREVQDDGERRGSGESVTDGSENMDCGAVQAVRRVVEAAGRCKCGGKIHSPTEQ